MLYNRGARNLFLCVLILFFAWGTNSQSVLNFEKLYSTYFSSQTNYCTYVFRISVDIDINYVNFLINGITPNMLKSQIADGKSLLLIQMETGLGSFPIEATVDSAVSMLDPNFECINYPANLAYQPITTDYPDVIKPNGIEYYFRVANFERRFGTGACTTQEPFKCTLTQYAPDTDPTLFMLSVSPIYDSFNFVSTIDVTITEPIAKIFTFATELTPIGASQVNIISQPTGIVYFKSVDPNSFILLNVQGDSSKSLMGYKKLGTYENGEFKYQRVKSSQLDTTFLIRFNNMPVVTGDNEGVLSFYDGANGPYNFHSVHNSQAGLELATRSSGTMYAFNFNQFLMEIEFDSQTYTQESMMFMFNVHYNEPYFTYPMGYSSGNLKDYTFKFTQVTSPYENTPLTYMAFIHSGFSNFPITTYTPNPIAIDSTPPEIVDFQAITFNNSFITLRLHIKDDISGFAMAQINKFGVLADTIDILPQHLVQGDLNDGIYEVIAESMFKKSWPIVAVDRSLNSATFDMSGVYNLNGKSINILKDNLSPETITMFYFEKPIVDVSQQGQSNTLYLNFIGAGPHSKVFFDLLLNIPDPSFILTSDIKYDSSFYHYWDPVLNLIKIDFYLPKGLVAGELNYYLQFNKPLSYQSLYQIVGSNSTLTIADDDTSNQLPPLVTMITTSEPTSILTISDTFTIQWTMRVETPKHRLKLAIFTISSDFDPVGVNITFQNFPPNYSLNYYDIGAYFEVSGDSRSQIYTISYAYLEDDEGLKSGFNALPWTNAFFQVEIPSITVTCQPVSDSLGPSVLYFTKMPSPPIDLVGQNRRVVFQYEAQDPSGILERLKPVVHLSGSMNTKLMFQSYRKSVFLCETNLTLYTTTNAKYESICDIPFGFGYPDGLLVSVYGFVDKYMNVFGYSSNDLKNQGYEYFINGSTSSKAPVIESSNNYNGAGVLTLNGYRFGLDSANTIVEIKTNNAFSPYVPQFKLFNSYYISFDYQSAQPFYIRIKNGYDPNYSNEYFVDFATDGSSTVSSSSSNVPSSSSVASSESSSTSTSNPSSSHSSSNDISSGSTNITPTKEPPKCPGTPKCGGDDKGVCLSSGGCQCKYPYYGEQCTSVIVVIPTPKPNPNNPSTNITIDIPGTQDHVQLSTLVSIVSLKEIDNNNVDAKTFTFDQWIYTSITNDIHLYETSIINNDIKTNISVRIEFFNDTKIIYFAGQNLTMNPSTLKYQITMSPYSFQSSNNHLQFIMSAQLTASDNPDKCTFNEFSEGIENSDYLRLQIDDHSLYGRFIKRAIIDDRPTTVSNVLLDSEFKQYDKSNTKSTQSFIGISMPFFRKSVLIDPDFSILIDTDKASTKEGSICEPKSKSLSAAKIAGIVIGSVAFAAIIVVSVVYYVYKKRQYGKMKRGLEQKLQSLS